MCQQLGHRHSIFCIVPPYVLRQIAQTGTEEQRQAALDTLAADSTFRTLRAIRLAAPVATATPATVSLSAEVGTGEAKQLQRTIFDCHNTRRLPGDPVLSEGAPATNDPAVDEAYEGLGATYDFYWETLRRNSIDDQGMPLSGHVHFGNRFNNAFWDGQRMVFGDGDGMLFNRLTIAIDIMGHELTHGVTETEAQLIYQDQSGALNESVSDVYGSLVKHYNNGKQAAEDADWLIGKVIWADQARGVALRSMKDPGSAFEGDQQPGHMSEYVNTIDDNGGVHINSGIPNRAFYLAATRIGGYAGEKAGPIWYASLRDPRLKPDASFVQFARLTVINAQILFPGGQERQRSFKTPGLKWASSYKFDCQRLARRLGDGQGTALHSSLLTIMRVQFKTDGGFVYLPDRSAPVTIDTDDLSAEEAKELERLLEAAGFFDLPQTSPPPRGAADYLRYTISATSPEHSYTVHLTDPIEDPDLQPLVEYLEVKARQSRKMQ